MSAMCRCNPREDRPMTKIMHTAPCYEAHSVQHLVANGISLLFSAEFDRFQRKLTGDEKLSIASALAALAEPIRWFSDAWAQAADENLAKARQIIERQTQAERADPLPAYDVDPVTYSLEIIFDELERQKEEKMEIALNLIPRRHLHALAAWA